MVNYVRRTLPVDKQKVSNMSIPQMDSTQASRYVRSLIEAPLDTTFKIDTKGKIADVNEAAVKATGVARERLVGTYFCIHFIEPDRAREVCSLALAGGVVSDYPLAVRHLDGRLIHLLFNAFADRDENGKITGVVAEARDVIALKEAAIFMRSLIETSPDLLATVSSLGTITYVNEATIKALGIPREQLVGTEFRAYFHRPEDAEEALRAVLDRNFVTDYRLAVRGKDGVLIELLCNASIYRDAEGNVAGVFAAARDITEYMRLESQLRRQSMCLEAVNRVYREALTCETEEQLGQTCLSVAEWLTGSKFGYIGELNAAGLQDIIAVSNPGWEACNMPHGQAVLGLKNMPIRGIDRATLREGISRIVNGSGNIESHVDHFAPPFGHPPLTAFMGIPLKEGGKTTGMIALANKKGGYTPDDQENVESLATAIVEAFSRKRAELAVQHLNANIENLVQIRTEQLNASKSWATMQYQVVQALAGSRSWHDALQYILESIVSNVTKDQGCVWAAFWRYSEDGQALNCSERIHKSCGSLERFSRASIPVTSERGCKILRQVWREMKATIFSLSPDFCDCPRRSALLESELMSSGAVHGVAFPVYDQDKFFGVFEILTEHAAEWNADALEALGKQIGQYASRKEAESERQRLVNVVEQSSDAILTVSAMGLITSWNKGAEQILAFKPAEVLGKKISMLLSRTKDSRLFGLLQDALAAGKRVDGYETALFTSYGQSIDVLLFAVPWFTESGEYEGFSLTLHNITEKKEAERKVAEFYSVVSHELRTPLTSIRGVLGLIENRTVPPDSPEAAELVEVARTSTDRLIRLINDMLDLKKIEAGKMDLNRSRVDIRELVASSLFALSAMAGEAGVSLVSEATCDGVVYADRDKAVQIITNLVSNAIKFSPPQGSVQIIAEPAGASIRFRVLDHGPGIAAHNISRLFDKFQQLDSSDTRPVGGTGLGLAITKALVEEHGGTIGVKSTVSVGSEFWFELPVFHEEMAADEPDGKIISESQRPDTADGTAAPFCAIKAGVATDRLCGDSRKCRILIVDDDVELRRVLSAQIRARGLECLEASGGQEALEIVQQKTPDLIILDVIMPELDGFAVVNALRQQESTSKLPVIVYSCRELGDNERELLVLGVTRYLLKGEASQADLTDTVIELLQLICPQPADRSQPR
jgi:PAS domain S-box-containing protein